MGKPMHLEELRKIFSNDRNHLSLAIIKSIVVADDRSYLKCLVSIWPENGEPVVARMTFDMTGFRFPQVNDLVLVAIPYEDESQIIILKQMTSKEDRIPIQAMTGDTSVLSIAGKKLWLSSDTRINISRSDVQPTEPLVLGNVMKACIQAIIQAFTNAPQVGVSPTGPVVLHPSVKQELNDALATYVSAAETNIVSQLAFTERGNS